MCILTSFVPPSDIFGHANSYQISNNTSYYSVYFPTKLIEHYNFCEGEVQTYDYLFKNAGQLPLVISSVRSGCGCYAASWPKDAIQAGDTGVISGRYYSRGRPGKFHRTLTVIFKDDIIPRQMLHVKGYTVPKDKCQSKK